MMVKKIINENEKLPKSSYMLEEFKAYDKILNPVVIADESGKIIYINKGVEKLFGYRAYEVLSNNITFLMLNEDAVQHSDYINKYLTTGIKNILGQNREVFARKKDNSAIHINIFLNELLANDTRYFIAEITDLSRQREAEKKLEQVNEDWQSVFNSLPQPAALSTLDGTMLYVTQAFLDGTGFTKEELLGQNITGLDMWLDNNREVMLSELQKNGYIEREFQFRVKSGKLIDTLYSAKLVEFNDQTCILASLSNISTIKEAEKSIRKAQENFKKLFDTNPSALIIQNSQWKILFVNKAFCDLSGYTEDEMLGKSAGDLGLWVDPAQRQEMLDEFKAKGEVLNKEYRFRLKSGRIYDTLFSTTLIELNGEVCHFTNVHDNTERKQAEETIRKSNENFKMLFNNNPNALLLQDSKWDIIGANKAFVDYSGYSEKELYGKNAEKLGLLINPEQKAEILKDIYEKGEIKNKEFRYIKKSGEVIDTLTSIRTIELNGETCYFSIFHDDTERKQAAETIKQAKNNLEQILNLNPNTTIITKLKNGEFIYVNQSFVDTIGYSREETIGKTVIELNIWVDIHDRQSLFEELKKNGFVHNKEYRFRTKSGNIITMLYASQIIELDGEQCLIAVGTDISEKKVVEETIRQSNERFQKFFNLNPEPCIISSLTGKISYVNEAFTKTIGYSRAEALNHSTVELGFWIDNDEREKAIKKLTKEGGLVNKHVKFRVKSGEILDMLYSGQIIDVDGEKQILSIVRDITDVKKNEDALIKSNEKFQNFFNHNPEPCSITNMQGDFMYVNEAFIRDSGYTRDEIAKVNARTDLWVDPEARDAFIQELTKVGYVLKKEVQFRLKGVVRDFLYSVQLIENNGEKQLLSIFNEITEIKKKETALAKSNERFREFFNLNPEPSVITDAQTGRYVNVNEAFAKVSGYSQEFLIGKTVADIDGWVDTGERDELMSELQKNGIALNKLVHLRKNGGEILDTEISAQLFDIDGKKQILFITRNITEQKRNEEALRQSNERFQKFFDLNPEPCIISNINTGGKIVYANDAFVNDVGFTRKELIGNTSKALRIWVNPEEQDVIVNELKQKGIIQNK